MTQTMKGTPKSADLRIFISHAAKDNSRAVDLARHIRLAHPNVHVWEFGEHRGFGRDIWLENIRPALEDADVFLLLCSANAGSSEGVSREIGMLDSLWQRSAGLRPAIVGILLEYDAPLIYAIRDFNSGCLIGRSLDISNSRNVNLDDQQAGRLPLLLQMLASRVRFFGARNACVATTENPSDIPLHAFSCMRHLFPDDGVRNEPDEILRWLQLAFDSTESRFSHFRRRKAPANPSAYFGWKWAELLATLEVADRTIGVAHLSIDRHSGWIFGNYFGVINSWRGYGRARHFFEIVEEKAFSFCGDRRGFLFEVAALNIDALVCAAQKIMQSHSEAPRNGIISTKKRSLTETELETVRCFLRLIAFGDHGALALTTKNGEFVRYRQPAVKEPIGETNEIAQHLLVKRRCGRRNGTISAHEVFSFLFDQVYYDSRVRLPTTSFPDYEQYLIRLKEKTLEALLAENGSLEVALVNPEIVIRSQFDRRCAALGVSARLSAVVAFRKEMEVPL
jgi:hypothetical protein